MKYLVSFSLCISLLIGYSQRPFYVQKEDVVHILYRNCINDLWLYTPEMCEDMPFEVKISDAIFWQDSIDMRHLKVIPRGNRADIEMIYYDGNGKIVIVKKELKVFDTPGITRHFEVDGKWTNLNRTIHKNSKITFSILPDSDFLKEMPNECDYRIESIEISIIPPNFSPPILITKIEYDIHKHQFPLQIILPEACFAYGAGTQIYLYQGEIYRKNGQGKLIYEFFRCTLYERIMVFYVE